jgi:hypothetical protein
MTDNVPGAVQDDGPGGLTDAEKLAALETYLKVLKPTAETLRAAVTADMGKRRVERVGAYLPDGTKMAAVGYSSGRTSARITDETAALNWVLARYPTEVQVIKMIRPAFLKVLLDDAKANGVGIDKGTGEVLPFIEVSQGAPYVTVTTTTEGVERMASLANGFIGMLEGPQ